MATSENLEPWSFRPTFADSWISDAFARDAETLTKALQKSFSDDSNTTISPFVQKPEMGQPQAQTPTVSGLSCSDPETAAPKRQRSTIPAAGGKVSKRKSRASKKSQTTFITADPANFRQMVQQVTGVRFGNAQVPMILKPEPQRPGGNRLPAAAGCLPTLDTSAFLLDHHLQHVAVAAAGGVSSGPDGAGNTAGLDFDTFPTTSFPTLESWKVM